MFSLQLKKLLDSFGIDISRKIYLYGAGMRGQQIAEILLKIGVSDFMFCDNDSKKHDIKINGILCCSPKVLCEHKDSAIIFCIDNEVKLYEELKQTYAHVIKAEELNVFFFIPEYAGYHNFYPIGHFYSLYPNLDYVEANKEKIFDTQKKVLDIEFAEEEQLKILVKMKKYYDSIPGWGGITEQSDSKYRYRYLNNAFPPADSVSLHCMLRILRPNKMIEVGSGWSSAVTLDTNEFYLEHNTELTFIEPYPTTLKSILKSGDKIKLIEKKLQDIPLETFNQLEDGDVLFIDSTHVSKLGSDVNYLFFEVFPRIKSGVYIHLHDIFYPFEYSEEWLLNGMVWNELYLLRAWLMNNSDYAIVFFQNMMEKRHMGLYKKEWPLDFPIHGGSFWMRKL